MLYSANSDIKVLCGSQTVDLQILLCPIYFNGYNESLLALNSEHSKHQCKGTPDWAVDPPVVKFNFSITEEAITACSSKLTVGYLSLKTLRRCHSHNRFLLNKLKFFFLKGHSGGGNWTVCRLLPFPVHQHLRHDLLRGPKHRSHYLSPRGDVQVLLPIPPAVPDQQYSDERVSGPSHLKVHTRSKC